MQIKINKKEFINTFIAAMPIFRSHCFRVTTQYQQLYHLKTVMKDEVEATVQMDYAENWACKYQDEITAVYFDKDQVTIHPMVVHAKKDGDIEVASYVGISGVTAHSASTTYAFIIKLMRQLKTDIPNSATLHFVTDSPTSQYRNRNICALVAKFPLLFGVTASWTWLKAGHGKGPCDGVGGGIKKKADNLVKAGSIISNSNEFCQAIRESPSKMTLFEVTAEDIEECKRTMEVWKAPSLPGIMSAHALVRYDADT